MVPYRVLQLTAYCRQLFTTLGQGSAPSVPLEMLIWAFNGMFKNLEEGLLTPSTILHSKLCSLCSRILLKSYEPCYHLSLSQAR